MAMMHVETIGMKNLERTFMIDWKNFGRDPDFIILLTEDMFREYIDKGKTVNNMYLLCPPGNCTNNCPEHWDMYLTNRLLK